MKKFGLSIALLCFLAGLILAHPHIRKTVGASAQGVQLKLSYFTLPYNAEHMADVEEGFVFHCGRATLEISGEIESSGVKVSTGQYDVRAKALTADEWTLLLIPKAPDGSEGQQEISLESRSMKGQHPAHHLNLDLTSGHGSTDGKLILSVAFGPRTVEGILSLPAPEA
jgi:hypothetical protein